MNLNEKNLYLKVCESIFKYTRTLAILQLIRRPPTSMLICNAVTIQIIDTTEYINDLNVLLRFFVTLKVLGKKFTKHEVR